MGPGPPTPGPHRDLGRTTPAGGSGACARTVGKCDPRLCGHSSSPHLTLSPRQGSRSRACVLALLGFLPGNQVEKIPREPLPPPPGNGWIKRTRSPCCFYAGGKERCEGIWGHLPSSHRKVWQAPRVFNKCYFDWI